MVFMLCIGVECTLNVSAKSEIGGRYFNPLDNGTCKACVTTARDKILFLKKNPLPKW